MPRAGANRRDTKSDWPSPRRGDDHAAGVERRDGRDIGRQRPHLGGIRQLDQIEGAASPDAPRLGPERGRQTGRRVDKGHRIGREIETDAALGSLGAEQPTAGVEFEARPDLAHLPEHVGRRQSRMAAEIHLDGGREPPQTEPVDQPGDEGGLGQVHLRGH